MDLVSAAASVPRPEEIRAVISLTDDPNPRVARAAFARLEALLRAMHGSLPQDLLADAPPAARRLALESRAAEDALLLQGHMERAIRGSAPLEEGALAIARLGNPDLDAADCRKRLDAWADEVRPIVAGSPPGEALCHLGQALGEGGVGLVGNRQAFYDPRNSYLDQVIERGVGIPITLSVIYILVGRRAGLRVDGVGIPGHFVVRAGGGPEGGEEALTLVDPFEGGRRIYVADLAGYLMRSGYGFVFDYLKAMPEDLVLRRMIRNLALVFARRGDRPSSIRLEGLLLGLASAPSRSGP